MTYHLSGTDTYKGRTVFVSRDDESADLTVMRLPFDDELSDTEYELLLEEIEAQHQDQLRDLMGSQYRRTEYDRGAEELVKFERELRI